MLEKQLSENLFCTVFSMFCCADEILEITVSQYNKVKSDSLFATFSVFSLGRMDSVSFLCLPQNILSANCFLNTFQINMIGLGKLYVKFWHVRCSKWNCPEVG